MHVAGLRLSGIAQYATGLPYNVVIRKGKDAMEVEKVQRPEAPADLEAIANASLEELEPAPSGEQVAAQALPAGSLH